MKGSTKKFILFMILILLIGCFEYANAQISQKIDTTKKILRIDVEIKKSDSTKVEEEIELLEINIEAVIEKPRVAILPKRIEPELGEIEFIDRSFEAELKKVPDKPMIMDNRLFVPQKIEDLKQKVIEKKD